MTTKTFISAILIFILVSCNNTSTQDKQKQETPKALQEDGGSYKIVSKRNYDDLVEILYTELVSKDNNLKSMENKIDQLLEMRNDSTKPFNQYNSKNISYYGSAERHVSRIQDSALRSKLQAMVAVNLANYNSKIAGHNQLIEIIKAKEITITDLHTVLKIVKTMPLIEKYQNDNLPAKKPFEGYIKEQDETIKLIDSLSRN